MPSTDYEKDRELVEACVRGDSNGWMEFERAYGRLLRSIVYRFDRQLSVVGLDAEDLKGHIYEKLLDDSCRRMRAWKGRAKFSTYLVMVSRNLALDFLEQQTRGPAMERYDDMPEQGSDDESVADREWTDQRVAVMVEGLNSLPERQAVILRLRMEGQTLREIATNLNKPVGTISVESSRAMERLRMTLTQRHPELWEGGQT